MHCTLSARARALQDVPRDQCFQITQITDHAVVPQQSTWISKASERQRRGRAGRVRPGLCFHMYSRQRSESLQEYQLPQLMRSPLDEVCLQVKLLGRHGLGGGSQGRVAEFLAEAVEPPPVQAVEGAITMLQVC